MSNTVFIVSGSQGEGKTTRIKELIPLLQERGIKMAGFIAEGSWEGDARAGFRLTDIQNNGIRTLCTTKFVDAWLPLGRFYFDPAVIRWGERILEQGLADDAALFVIDEMGKFELAGKVWHDAFVSLCNRQQPLLITVRASLVEQYVEQFGLRKVQVFTVEDLAQIVADQIAGSLE